jgi:hypothetical protein
VSRDAKLWLGLFGVLALAAVVPVAVARHRQVLHRQEVQFEKIQVGMTEGEVISLMGRPPGRRSQGPKLPCEAPNDGLVWDEWYVVVLDGNSKLVLATYLRK